MRCFVVKVIMILKLFYYLFLLSIWKDKIAIESFPSNPSFKISNSRARSNTCSSIIKTNQCTQLKITVLLESLITAIFLLPKENTLPKNHPLPIRQEITIKAFLSISHPIKIQIIINPLPLPNSSTLLSITPRKTRVISRPQLVLPF